MDRRHNFQSIAWFNDLRSPQRLVLDPPYQRKSVWNQAFKDYFIETVLFNYPAPAIFLHEEMSPEGKAKYNVVDGKQRLTTIFEFIDDVFPVPNNSKHVALHDKYFSELDISIKVDFWNYQFTIEYLPGVEEVTLSDIFNRINRNVSKLKAQELRHAKFDGVFINSAAYMTEYLSSKLPSNFPNISPQSKKQMKDIEYTSILLLTLELGADRYDSENLDLFYSQRDDEWEWKETIEYKFKQTIDKIADLINSPDGSLILNSRLKNQADFLSLFSAVNKLIEEGDRYEVNVIVSRLIDFITEIDNEDVRRSDQRLTSYYEAARTASSNKAQRETRENVLLEVIRT